jgi:hypothetical protein
MSLEIYSNDDASVATVDFADPPDWESFTIADEVTSMHVKNANREQPIVEENFAHAAYVIQSHRNITEITFDNCSLLKVFGVAASPQKATVGASFRSSSSAAQLILAPLPF